MGVGTPPGARLTPRDLPERPPGSSLGLHGNGSCCVCRPRWGVSPVRAGLGLSPCRLCPRRCRPRAGPGAGAQGVCVDWTDAKRWNVDFPPRVPGSVKVDVYFETIGSPTPLGPENHPSSLPKLFLSNSSWSILGEFLKVNIREGMKKSHEKLKKDVRPQSTACITKPTLDLV